ARGDLDPAFAAAESVAFTLDVGAVSAPVRTPLGLHLIHLDEKSGDRVRASQILVRLEASPADSAKARERAGRLAARARSGKPFGALAKDTSDDTATAAAGGSLGSVPLEALPPAFRKPLETAAAGDVIGPLDSPGGLEIVHLVSREGARKPSFD